MKKLSHLDKDGKAKMVDVSAKVDTAREARAEATIFLSEDAFRLVMSGDAPKGDVLAAARLAGIMAAKKTSELIPLCHPLALSHADVEFEPLDETHAFRIVASARTTGPTGVEMEALTAASVAALTVYDMVKAVDRSAHIEGIRLVSKSGGKSGTYEAGDAPETKAPARARAKPSPSALLHEATNRVATNIGAEREALRAFMMARRLRASEWAKSAKVPVGELYAFLNGRTRALSAEAGERLARAARASVDEMFGRSQRR